MNELPHALLTGTFGELLVQIRLLQHGVQAVAPHKDTGNDLLGFHGEWFRAVQVKTRCSAPVEFNIGELNDCLYHVLAIVLLGEVQYDDLEDFEVKLDSCRIFLLDRAEVTKGYYTLDELQPRELSKERVRQVFWGRAYRAGR